MLDVFLTVDVEVWCDGWESIDAKFSTAFERYVYGPTPQGNFGLGFQAELLSEHGLHGVFFVEPMFALRFGMDPLREIVSLIRRHGHEVQLHLHTEWIDEARDPPVDMSTGKRQFLRQFSLLEQKAVIRRAKELLTAAHPIDPIRAFRAGSFGFDLNTLSALADNSIYLDSSYNASLYGMSSGLMPGRVLVEPLRWEATFEYPMTVFRDGLGKLRHVQLTACSYREIEALLWQALEQQRRAFIVLSHNSELLTPSKEKPDGVVVDRFRRLCAFLSTHRDVFRVRGFNDLIPRSVDQQPLPLAMPAWTTAHRVYEQLSRRLRA